MTATDLRVQRTLLAIKNAFLSLLRTRSFEETTVLDICQTALINPKTFYKYYAGKSALAGELIKAFKTEFAELQRQRLAIHDGEAFWRIAVPFYNDRRQTLLALWKINTKRHHLWQDMHEMIKQNFIRHARNKHPDTPAESWDFQAELFANMLLHGLHYAFTHHKQLEWAQLFDQAEQMVRIVKR